MSTMKAERERYFGSLYESSPDPYGVRHRWYEQRKQAILLASLPHASYRNVFEPACGIGDLTAKLAARCKHLLASDFNAVAAAAAASNTADLPNVRVETQVLPRDWPYAAAPFDLIVLSEIGYFLSESELREVAALCSSWLTHDGALVACHWTCDFPQRTLLTTTVHALLGTGLQTMVRHAEADFLLQVWTRDGRSVAQQDGIR